MAKKYASYAKRYDLAEPPAVLPDSTDVYAEIRAEANAPVVSAVELPVVAIDVWCQTSGKKFDQTKSFAAWTKRQGIKALPIPAWRELWQQFQNRIIK